MTTNANGDGSGQAEYEPTGRRSGSNAPGIAFVTGGARGLGNAIAVSFAREGAKAVAIIDIQDDETFNQGKRNVEVVGAEVSYDHLRTYYYHRSPYSIVTESALPFEPT